MNMLLLFQEQISMCMLMTKDCFDVQMEQELQPPSGEALSYHTANSEEHADLDIARLLVDEECSRCVCLLVEHTY